MNDLPKLPFEKVLSYLSLEDRLRLSAVSRGCHHKVFSSRVTSLCYSERPIGGIVEKSRWVSGAFVENFISSIQFASFFNAFSKTILSTLKHLRLCDLLLTEGEWTSFARNLNLFGQLEQLDIIRAALKQQDVFKLNLPKLTGLQLEYVDGILKLTLEAPRLHEVKILNCYDLRLVIVHGKSVERLLVERLNYTEVSKLENLQALYIGEDQMERIDPTLLSSLQQLKEFHANEHESALDLLNQKELYGRADLKIYLCGLLLNGPGDPAENAFRTPHYDTYLRPEAFVQLTKNRSRLADEIPLYSSLDYSVIEAVAPGLEVDVLKRFTDLKMIRVARPVQNIQRFLDLLKNIIEFTFYCNLPQDLFDRLPEHSAVQRLTLHRPPSDLTFLFRLKHLIELGITWSIDSETIRRAFEELPVLSCFSFKYGREKVSIRIGHPKRPKQLRVWVGVNEKFVPSLNAAIDFITGSDSLAATYLNVH